MMLNILQPASSGLAIIIQWCLLIILQKITGTIRTQTSLEESVQGQGLLDLFGILLKYNTKK